MILRTLNFEGTEGVEKRRRTR